MTEAAKHIYTAANITNEERSLYSDLYKEINDIRPRWHASDEEIARFLNNYDDMFEAKMEDDRRQLEYLSDEHGQTFKHWGDYYDFLDRKDREEYEARMAARREKESFLKAFFAPFSIVAAITLWEEGAI